MDMYKLTCLACGETFGMTETDILTMTECRCPRCNAKMSVWQLCELKREYYSLMLKLREVISAGIVPIPNVQMFTWNLAEAEGDTVRQLLHEIKALENKEE